MSLSPSIVALETPYKGCRFRSRLEARWAVFYDLVGLKWTYENDPISVSGENYLPDFVVHDGLVDDPFIHEVKPESSLGTIRPQVVYLAGKMRPEHDWRGPLSCLDRSDRRGATDDRHVLSWSNVKRPQVFHGTGFVTNGPFASSCDHACAHSDQSLHMAETCETEFGEGAIVSACKRSLANCDIVCAHLNTRDCYGTLVEIGIASGLRKKICVTVDETIANNLERKQAGHDGAGPHDLWFACSLADCTRIVEDSGEARKFHGDFIRHHTAREYRLISGIGNSGRRAALTFGDPLHVATHAATLNWDTSIDLFCENFRRQAEEARGYRFVG